MYVTLIIPFPVGGMGLLVSAFPKCALVAALVAPAGALHPAAVSAVVPSTAVIVHIAVPQGAASAPPVKTMTTSIPAPTTAQLRTLHALFQLILTDGRLNFRQAHHVSQTLIFNSETLVCAIATRAALSVLWKA